MYIISNRTSYDRCVAIMMGKGHMISNVALGTTCVVALAANMSEENAITKSMLSTLFPEEIVFGFQNGIYYNAIVFLSLAIFAFVVGTFLPDIDRKQSVAGKVLYIPLEHRTWTHSIWAVLLFTVMSFGISVFRFLLLGYVLHIWMDSFSAAGVCFFYPFVKYRKYGNRAFVAPHHKLKLYHTNMPSEGYFTFFVCMLCILVCILERRGFVSLFHWIVY